MFETDLYQTDDELEQALYAALGREPAPDTLILRVERRAPCFAARRAPAIPSFGLVSVLDTQRLVQAWSIDGAYHCFRADRLPFPPWKKGQRAQNAGGTHADRPAAFCSRHAPERPIRGWRRRGAHDILQGRKGSCRSPKRNRLFPHGAEE